MIDFFTIPVLCLIFATALICGMHPVFLQLVPTTANALFGRRLSVAKTIQRMLLIALVIGLGWWLVGFLFGLLLAVSPAIYLTFAILSAGLVTIVGTFELASIIWPRMHWMRPTPQIIRHITKHSFAIRSNTKALKHGLYLLALTLIYCGALYPAVISLLRPPDIESLSLVAVLFSATAILPFVAATCLLAKYKTSTMLVWVNTRSRHLRALTIAVLVVVGWLVLLQANTTINFGL